ncbi:MAG TPA: TRAP transporter small permease [Pseudolabrys sp.]|nr:TRAP transporter small permease [Pseudolabrys sp.]
MNLDRVRAGFERLLEAIVVILVAALTLLVICGFCFRYIGHALSWYDEIASVGLVWLTYYGSALAALRGAHIGVPGFVNAMPPGARVAATLFAEAVFFIFFIMLAWTGFEVMAVLGNDSLISVEWIPQRVTSSAVPIGAVLVIVAEALRIPRLLKDARGKGFIDTEAIEAMSHGAPDASGSTEPAR